MVAYYARPPVTTNTDRELCSLVARIFSQKPEAKVIVTGDFNRNQDKMKQLATRLNIPLASFGSKRLTTCVTTRLGRTTLSQTDYCLTNLDCES